MIRTTYLDIFKFNAENGEGVGGAVFELVRLGGRCGCSACQGVSDFDGRLRFCLQACASYLLREVSPPLGFVGDGCTHKVKVDRCGRVFVDCERTNSIKIANTPQITITAPRLLGWMRSSETYGMVPGARIPNIPPADGVFNGWTFPWTREYTLMQYFENDEIRDAALSNLYSYEALGVPETFAPVETQQVGVDYVWDGGTSHQIWDGYSNEMVNGGWASWANVDVPTELTSPQTLEPIEGGYTPYHYSLRRFSAYIDIDFSNYSLSSAYLVTNIESESNDQVVIPLNDSLFVFVNGNLAFWTSSDLYNSGNVAQNRLYFYNEEGILMSRSATEFAFSDGWYLTLDKSVDSPLNIARFLTDGKNVVDVIADDFYQGGGVARFDIEFNLL